MSEKKKKTRQNSNYLTLLEPYDININIHEMPPLPKKNVEQGQTPDQMPKSKP